MATGDEAGRTGGQVLADQLTLQGVEHAFCVPGESYLAVLDALHDARIAVTVCRQEGGAAMMAEAHGKLTGTPGVCFVTRGPGATNASPGVHIARQDSTPMILFVGQVARHMKGREAFQELDYAATFGSVAKWATEVDDAARLPELISRAFHVATSGRPGPVVIGLPEDMLTDRVAVPDARRYRVPDPVPAAADIEAALAALARAERPLVIAGGTRWTSEAVGGLARLSERLALPVAVSFRRQSLFPCDHPHYIGDLGVGAAPYLAEYARSCDVVLALGTRMSEVASQGYTLLDIPTPRQRLIHVHPGADELGRVYAAEVAINTAPPVFVAAMLAAAPTAPPASSDRAGVIGPLRGALEQRMVPPERPAQAFDFGAVMVWLRDRLAPDTVICNGAGNYATWVHRFYPFNGFGTQLAPTSGSMGYGVPAAVAAARLDPSRPVVAFAGDGCFLMHGQEFATAVQYDLPILVIVLDNGMFGTIRMHQERHYPGRVVATDLRNPDFADYARAFGGHGERVERTGDFAAAYKRAVGSGKPAIIHCLTDPEALTVDRSLGAIRDQARRSAR